ncbi:hypothetical protein [Paraburkholderia atlantica]|uniref:Uncharacterized protein n=1 Tax=Paraburkholderia atlantica TaxID=2654982 RepID=D5WNL9_PARAM|nr:hypothetical protein [Paraburkholderia atlantica]ADG20898.1 hypothetical protein BC1002_7152 [Paraburkholderia atlantica]MBB5510965.1 hypothetical protein [Paraburkholderia atlantica]
MSKAKCMTEMVQPEIDDGGPTIESPYFLAGLLADEADSMTDKRQLAEVLAKWAVAYAKTWDQAVQERRANDAKAPR